MEVETRDSSVALILFKVINVVALLQLYVLLVWFGISSLKYILQVFGVIGALAGVFSLFMPNTETGRKLFIIFSLLLYVGVGIFFVV